MPRRKSTPEAIGKLHEVEVLVAKGSTVAEGAVRSGLRSRRCTAGARREVAREICTVG
jgi:hypothetical protein